MKRALLLSAAALALAPQMMISSAFAAAPDEETVHVVGSGETLGGIANRAGVSAGVIAKANGLAPPYTVRVGQKLDIPRDAPVRPAARVIASRTPSPAQAAASADEESTHVVQAGETLNGIANRAGVSAGLIAKTNGLEPPYTVKVGQKLDIPRDAPAKPAAQVIASKTSPTPVAAATPMAAASLEEESVHLVRPGESLGSIAVRAKVPRVLIAEANGLQPPFIVKAGQKLQIPRTRRYTVAGGDTGFSVSMKYGVPWDQIALANSVDPETPIKPGQTLLIPTLLNPPPTGVSKLEPAPAPTAMDSPAPTKTMRFGWPVDGPIRRGFATGGDYHDGIDITAPKGTMVRAAAAGTVKFAGKEKDQFGNLVVLDHGDGWYTAYGFLSRVTVKEGAKVAAGERVGLVGNTGRAKGSELHFEVRQDGKPVDPVDELPKAP